MNMELAVMKDGGVLLVSDRPLADTVRRVEYYRDQKLFMLVYEDEGHEGDLMHYEIPEKLAGRVSVSPNIIIYTLLNGRDPSGYQVPLVQVGV